MVSDTKKTLLLVEDEVVLAMSTQRNLKKYGYNVLVVNTGEKAVNICREDSNIDLILMDIDLGKGIDGTKAAELILKKDDLPVLFLSSHTEPEIVDKTEKITSYGYVVKSSSITVLDASIKMAFKLFEASQKVHASEENLRSIFNNMHDIYYKLDSNGKIVEASPSAVELYEYNSLDDLKGIHANNFIYDLEENKILKGELKKNGFVKNYRIKHKNKNGKPIFLEANINIILNKEGVPTGQVGSLRDISNYLNVEDMLRKSEHKFSMAFFNHPIAMQIINIKTGKRVDMNERCIELFGIDKKEFQKGNIYKNNISTNPEARKLIIEKLVQNKTITNIPLDIIRTTGEIKNLLASGSLLNIDDGELGIFSYVDITDSKKAELELIRSEEKYRRLVENLGSEYYFYSHNTKGMKSYISPSVTKMLGYSLEESMYHYGSYLTDNPINKDVDHKTKLAIKGIKQEPYFAESYHKDGSTRLMEITETPVFDENNNVIAIEGIAHDVTERKKAEGEIKQQLLEKEIILKEVHHRIKNNFASISSLLSLQAQEITNQEAISALKDAIGRVNSMQVLYERLLITENYQVTSANEYLNNLIDDIINLFSDAIFITVKKDIDNFQLDAKRMVPVGIIVNELLTNIMKYAFEGKTSGLIKITVIENSGNITLTIQDNGNGLPKNFDSNIQTGFGLMLVKMLSKQLEGNLTMENSNGVKSTLEFNI